MNSKRKQYPNYYNRANYTKGWTCDGRRVFDCANLIKAACWANGNFNADPVYNASQDVNAGGLKKLCTKTGAMSSLPEVPGVLLFKEGHVGVYIGNGMTIHAKGHSYDVVKEKLGNVPWTSWGYLSWIKYETTTQTNKTGSQEAFVNAFSSAVAAEAAKQAETPTYTHKVTNNVNVRKGPGIRYKRLEYKDFPEYIKKQMKEKLDCIPIGVKVHRYANNKGWYKIDKDKEIWIAGNYSKQI